MAERAETKTAVEAAAARPGGHGAATEWPPPVCYMVPIAIEAKKRNRKKKEKERTKVRTNEMKKKQRNKERKKEEKRASDGPRCDDTREADARNNGEPRGNEHRSRR